MYTRDLTLDTGMIPSEINYIWLGGPLPEKYLRTIHQLAAIAAKSGFTIHLWVDKESNYYKTAMNADLDVKNLQLHHIAELDDLMCSNPYFTEKIAVIDVSGETKTLSRLAYFSQLINREMVGEKNLAAASDIIRYIILYLKGGYYLDTDNTLNLKENNVLRADEAPYGILTNGVLKGSILQSINNNMLGAKRGARLMGYILNQVIHVYSDFDTTQSYRKKTSMDNKRMTIKYSSEPYSSLRRDLTVIASGPGVIGTILRTFISKEGVDKRKLFFTHIAADNEEAFNVANISMTSESDKVWLIGLDQNEKSAAMWLLNELKEMQAVTSHSNNIDLVFYEKMQKKLSSDTTGAAKASSAASAAVFTEKNYLNEFIEMREFFVNIFISGLEKYSSQRAGESTKDIVKQELADPLFSIYNNIKGFFHKKKCDEELSNQQKNVNTPPDSKQAKLANMKLYIRFLSKHKNTYPREWQALWLIAETHKKFSYVLADEEIKLNRDEINLIVATVPDKSKKMPSYEAPGKSFSKK